MPPNLGRRRLVSGAAGLSATLWLPRSGRAAANLSFDEARHLLSRTGLGATCGSCIPTAEAMLEEARARRELPLPVLAQAA